MCTISHVALFVDKCLPHQHLRFGVAAFNTAHVIAALLGCVYIHKQVRTTKLEVQSEEASTIYEVRSKK